MSNVEAAGELSWPAGDAGGADVEKIFRAHYPRLVSMLARLTGNRSQAEEIAADAICKLPRRGAARGAEDAAPWLYRVAINAGIDAIRANSRRQRFEQEACLEDLRGRRQADALDDLLREERRARVRTVLASLKPRDAQLLLLRSSGMAYHELASAIGVQPGSVGTLLARAEAEFERKFRARYGDDV